MADIRTGERRRREAAARRRMGSGAAGAERSAGVAAIDDPVSGLEFELRRGVVAAEDGTEVFVFGRFEGELDRDDSIAVLPACDALGRLAFGQDGRADLAHGDSAVSFGGGAGGVLLLGIGGRSVGQR